MTTLNKSANQILLNTLFANIPPYIFIFWKDINSVYLGCNENFAKLIGFSSAEEIIGKTDIDIGWLPDGDTAEFFRQGDKETMAGNYVINQKEWLSLPNGKKIFTLANKSPLYDDEGNLLGVLGVVADITEQMLEDERMLESMTLVSASIAHELRTPL